MKNWIQSVFLLITFFFCPSTVLRAAVGPIVPGQALWCIDQRIESNLDIISSKLDGIDPVAISLFQEILCSKIELITQNVLDSTSTLAIALSLLDNVDPCAAIAIMASTTISAQGIYCVSTNFTGSILVSASDVVIDVNNHTINGSIEISANRSNITIFNGTIQATSSTHAIEANAGCRAITLQNVTAKNGLIGISFDQVTDGLIEGCTLVQNTTGVQLNQSHKIVIQESIADCNRNAGFDLIASTTCCLSDCKSLSSGQGNMRVLTNNVFGFVATNGSANIFERCIANSTQAISTTDFDSVVAGFALRGTESCGKIIECEAANATTISSGVTVPYGILLQKTVNAELMLTTFTTLPGTTRSVSWSPDGKFFAAAESAGADRILVFAFDRTQPAVVQQAVATINDFTALAALDWSPGHDYIAVADTGADDIAIFKFERVSNTLTLVCRADVQPGNPFAIEWSLDGRYLAVADTVGTVVLVYKFDAVQETLTRVASYNTAGSPVSVGWRADGEFIVVADEGINQVLVLAFNSATNTLSLRASNSVATNPVAVDWSPDGQFIAAGDDVADEIFIYRFNQQANTLTVFATADRKPTDVQSVVWSPDSRFLAVPDNPAGSPPFGSTILVYEYDRGSNMLFLSTRIENNVPDGPLEADWSPDGQYILLADIQDPDINAYIYEVMTFPSQNVLTNNTVYCNSGAQYPSGVGISGSSISNLIIQNRAYGNPLHPSSLSASSGFVGTNYEFVTNVFNPQFGQAPTLLQNISLNCEEPICGPVDVGLILQQTLSKACFLVDIDLPALESVVDALNVSAVSIPCDALSVTTATTLLVSGIYCLANSIVGTIQISGSDILLNLNNYKVSQQIAIAAGSNQITILNGEVSNTLGGSGIIAQSSSHIEISNVRVTNADTAISFTSITDALIKNCNVSDSISGVALTSCAKIVIEDTVAEKLQQKGFTLINSTTCCLKDCKAFGIGDGNTNILNQTVVGFSASNGYGNIFERCIANSTQALSVTDSQSIVAGFLLTGTERCSKIIECESANATTSPGGVTVPYGILLQAGFSGLVSVTAVNPGGGGISDLTFEVAWSPDGKYLAAAGGISGAGVPDLFLYRFDRVSQTLQQVQALNPGPGATFDGIYAIRWSPGGNYLAVGGPFDYTSDALRIYRFESTSETLQQVDSVNPGGLATDQVWGVSWSPDGNYLAVGGPVDGVAAPDLFVYKFDKVSETLQQVDAVNPGGGSGSETVTTVGWSPDGLYLAVGGGISGVSDLFIYRFDRASQRLQQVTEVNPGGGGDDFVRTLEWSFDGIYLAVGGALAGGGDQDLFIYRFDRVSQTLQQVDAVNPGGGDAGDTVYSLFWSPNGEYLAVGCSVTGVPDLFIYRFDRGTQTLQEIASVNPGGAGSDDIWSVAWSPDGQYLAVGGGVDAAVENDLYIFQVLTFPSNNVIKNNTVYCDSGAQYPSGVGISGSSIANMIIQNTVYANPLNVFMVGTNYQFVTNVFNQLFGQGPSLLQNISLDYRQPVCQPGDLELILKQIKYKVDTLGCEKIAITSDFISSDTVISITVSGAYCLFEDLTADMLISATCVSVDLNNRILTGHVTIQQAVDVVVQDGRIAVPAPTTSSDASQAAITIANSTLRTHIERVIIRCQDAVMADVAGRAGIELQGYDAEIIGCTIRSGSAGNSAVAAAPDGGDGIRVNTHAARGLISGCLIKTGAGGTSSAGRGGSGGHGVNVGTSTETKIINCTILETGAGGTGTTAGGIGGHGVNVQDGARKTMVTQLIIRDTGVSGSPESYIDVPIDEGGSVNIPLRSRAINDLIPTTVNGISSAFANTAYNIYDSARPYIFQSQLDTLSQGNPSGLPPLANEVTGNVVTGWSHISNVVFQSVVEVLG